MLTHVVAQSFNYSVAARGNLPGFPYIDFNTDRVEQSAAFSRLSGISASLLRQSAILTDSVVQHSLLMKLSSMRPANGS